MSLANLRDQLKHSPETIEFPTVITAIDALFRYTPTRFTNGSLINNPGSNEGSCKVFALAQLLDFSEQETLALFGHYYRDDVLQHLHNNDHHNIRQFMQSGWAGIQFDGSALIKK